MPEEEDADKKHFLSQFMRRISFCSYFFSKNKTSYSFPSSKREVPMSFQECVYVLHDLSGKDGFP
jgi:hypothetical protein